MSVSNIETLMCYGIVFPGLSNNQKKLFMPIELTSYFKELDSSELEKIVIRNTEWIQITQGMMYLSVAEVDVRPTVVITASIPSHRPSGDTALCHLHGQVALINLIIISIIDFVTLHVVH